jgi:hypothetical protein
MSYDFINITDCSKKINIQDSSEIIFSDSSDIKKIEDCSEVEKEKDGRFQTTADRSESMETNLDSLDSLEKQLEEIEVSSLRRYRPISLIQSVYAYSFSIFKFVITSPSLLWRRLPFRSASSRLLVEAEDP